MIREIPSDAVKVQTFIVIADSGPRRDCEVGMFFRVTDAEAHIASQLRPPQWTNARVEPRDVPLADIHPAHVPCLSEEHQKAWAKLLFPKENAT